MAKYWYSYVVPNGDSRLASSYQLLKMNNGRPGCSVGINICAIYTKGGGPSPFSPLSQNIQNYIAAALANGVPQPELPVNSRKYVYLKA